jgi:hypothetical protein
MTSCNHYLNNQKKGKMQQKMKKNNQMMNLKLKSRIIKSQEIRNYLCKRGEKWERKKKSTKMREKRFFRLNRFLHYLISLS